MRPRPLTTESLEWYEKMQKEYGVRPDANTFAVLIKGFLRINSRNVAKVLINEMTRKNIEPNQIFMSKYIGDPDIAEINQLFGEVFGSTSQLKGKDFSEKYLVSDVQDKAAHENSGAIVNPSSSASKGDAAGLPEVRSTGVLGIRLLKKMLNPLHENDLDAYEKQVRLEEEAYDAALERLKSINEARQDPLLMADRGSIRAYMSEWLPKLTALVEEEVNLCKKAQFKDRERGYYGPFLRLVPPEKLAIITISDTLRLHSQTMREHLTSSNGKVKGIKTSKLVSYIGNQVEMEYHHAELKKKKNSHLIARSINLQ
ncbi:DNA-directed RNA polymerase, partial [Spiromyces aspiralis]